MAMHAPHADAGVPAALDAFVGRVGERAEIAALLTTARLFTLTGTGGAGKTRLATRIATQLQSSFRHGVRWVDLSTVADGALVPHVVAARCGIDAQTSAEVPEALIAALQPQRLLLVLDNCEHLLPACAQLVETLLTRCVDLHILATSREALALPGEVIWLVPPLRVPDHNAGLSLEDALAYEGIELFVARASSVLPTFRLTADNVTSIVTICRLVEGLPLALELAAAQLRVLAPAELAVRLGDAGHLLTGGHRTAPPRQQTLRATLDWSYQLLSDGERGVFSRLASFAGSFSLAAAEAVGAGVGVAAAEVFDALAQLIQKSLVTVQHRESETRYRLLEPLRQYAHERLHDAGMERDAHRQHRDWYAALAAQAKEALSGPDQGPWLDRLATEYDNLRAALRWSLAGGDAGGAGQIAVGIWQFWLLRGRLHEGRRWVEQTLAALPDGTPLRAELLWIAGILARPDAQAAHDRFSESLALSQALRHRDATARALASLGFLAQAQGDHEIAVGYLERGQPLLRAGTDTPALARLLTGLVLSLLARGETERAAAVGEEALALHRHLGDGRGMAAAQANLGLIRQARGDEQRAAALWEASLRERRAIGDYGGMAHVLTLLGGVSLRRGDYIRAAQRYHESLELRRQAGDRDGVAPILEGLAAIAAAGNHLLAAVRLAAAAGALRTATGVPPSAPEHAALEQALARLRARLAGEAFALAWAEGRALSSEQVLAAASAVQAPDTAPVPERSTSEQVLVTSESFDLTPREIDVLRLLAQGLTYAQIADTLAISPRTVDAHVRAIFGKLQVRSRGAATYLALQHRLI